MNQISHTSDKIYRIIKPVGQITKKKQSEGVRFC